MKITFERIPEEEEDEIIVRSSQQNSKLMRALADFEVQDIMLTAYGANEIFRIKPEDIFYVESVDRNTFLYGEDQVYRVKYKLYELEEILEPHDFFRASKSTLVNLLQIRSFTSAAAGRFEAVMKNDERVLISRHYMSSLRKLLDL